MEIESHLKLYRKGEKITPEFDKDSNKISKTLVYSQRTCTTDEEIADKRLKKQTKADYALTDKIIGKYFSVVIQSIGNLKSFIY
ncbi:MAG: hypothetical protein IJU40_06435 [Desulfovibrionaceae bacterium]|nr:hypothetical protein [Desulfovibrionaceae bacterium]